MRRTLGSPLALVATAFLFHVSGAQAQVLADAGPLQFTDQELENLLAPVALYPDPILAQVLVAASYPEEVDLAARHVSVYGESGIDDQPWNISVKAVARYEPVLNLMADRLDWTTALGQAYVQQPEDVMAAVQSLRAMARAQGNLVTTEQHDVVVEDRHIRILPVHPRVVYVPVYDPLVVYHRPVVHLGVYRSGWSFGIGFPIGVWLAYDLDWRRRHVFYHGWDPYGHRVGWIHRSRPFIVINHIYVQPRPRVVVVNRRVINRYVDYRRFARYNAVHRQVAWDRHERQAVRRNANGASSRAAVNVRDDRAARNPSWDRSGRTRANAADRKAVERSSATPRSRRAAPERVTPQPRSSEPRQAQPRAQTRQSEPRQAQPRAQTRQSEPRQAQPRAQTRQSEPRQAQPRAQTRQIDTRPQQPRSQTRSAAPRNVQSRSQPQRAQPQRVSNGAQAAQQPRQSARPQADRSRTRAAPSKAQRSEARSASSERPARSSASKSRSAGRGRGSGSN